MTTNNSIAGAAESESIRDLLSWWIRLKWLILRTAMEERLVYRGDFAFATLIRFLPIVTQIFLWRAIFSWTFCLLLASIKQRQVFEWFLTFLEENQSPH